MFPFTFPYCQQISERNCLGNWELHIVGKRCFRSQSWTLNIVWGRRRVGGSEGWRGLMVVISAVRSKLVCFAPENQMAYMIEMNSM